jgi:hypothetical protein
MLHAPHAVPTLMQAEVDWRYSCFGFPQYSRMHQAFFESQAPKWEVFYFCVSGGSLG